MSFYTPISEISSIHETLRKTFHSGTLRPLQYRKHQLLQLARLVQENIPAIQEALKSDLGRPTLESTLTEMSPIVTGSLKAAEKLEEWAAPEVVQSDMWQAINPRILKAPKGVVLIIAPWNYPLILTLQPLIGAIAAGCAAVVKPSEHTPAIGTLLAELLPRYLDNNAYRIVNGGVPESTKLLELRWNHIFYTGNGTVGRIVATAAAKHLTPVTLELGGKSPVIVDGSYDLKLAAKRIFWGKASGSGQICVAPDYVLVPREKQAELIEGFREAYKEFFPEGALKSDSYSRIVNSAHLNRVKSVLDKTKGEIAVGGAVEAEKNALEPTVVQNVTPEDALMEDEIFGAVLAIVPVDSLDAAIDFVNNRPEPLALYVFTENPELKQKVIEGTQSGSLVFNDVFQQLAVPEIPFGGFGASGYGFQVGKYTFDGFTHPRSTVDVPAQAEGFLSLRYPPYNDEKYKILTQGAYIPIPQSS